jgi:hypothetical protein
MFLTTQDTRASCRRSAKSTSRRPPLCDAGESASSSFNLYILLRAVTPRTADNLVCFDRPQTAGAMESMSTNGKANSHQKNALIKNWGILNMLDFGEAGISQNLRYGSASWARLARKNFPGAPLYSDAQGYIREGSIQDHELKSPSAYTHAVLIRRDEHVAGSTPHPWLLDSFAVYARNLHPARQVFEMLTARRPHQASRSEILPTGEEVNWVDLAISNTCGRAGHLPTESADR